MTRHGSHGGASIRTVATALGISTATVRRDEASALAKLQAALALLADDLAEADAVSACLRRIAYRHYLERLAACGIGEEPEDEPPRCPWS